MAYIQSSKISAFPVVNRNVTVSNDIYARHTSEEILSGIVNRLIDQDGFVITSYTQFGPLKAFSFNIHGYYFKVETLNEILSLFPSVSVGTVIYATINLVKNGVWLELSGSDETDETENPDSSSYVYKAVKFSTEKATTSDTTFCIPILQYVGSESAYSWVNGWYVPDEYYVKFNGNSFTIDRIDGTELTSSL